MMEYKGYYGVVKYDDEAEIFHGDVLLAKGAVTFQGKHVKELKKAFHDSVDEYLKFCEESGIEPEKPFSGKLVLRLLGQSGIAENSVTDEEVKLVISEARSAGVMDKAETAMIAGVMRIADRSARGLMTPRHEVDVVSVTDSFGAIVRRFQATRRTRLLVRDGEADDIIGVVTTRDFLSSPPPRGQFDLRSVVVPAPVVQDRLGALEVIETLRAAPSHLVLVYDEHGHFEGIITSMDVLEAIAGDFDDQTVDEPKVFERGDGSLLVAGWMPVDEFAERIGMTLKSDREYQTVAGLVLERLGKLPDVGEILQMGAWQIEVVDLDGRRIDKLLVSRKDLANS